MRRFLSNYFDLLFYLLKTAAKCIQTYQFGDKKVFFWEGPSSLHHTHGPPTHWNPKYATADSYIVNITMQSLPLVCRQNTRNDSSFLLMQWCLQNFAWETMYISANCPSAVANICRATVLQARLMPSCGVCLSVCLSCCPSRSCIVSNRVIISSTFFTVGSTSFKSSFFHTEPYGNILTGASNARGMKKSRFSTNISLYVGNDTVKLTMV